MPWTPRDAKKHNKTAKTPKLQKQWAAVANSVLAQQLAKGKKQAEAEGLAIASANAAIARSVEKAPPVARSAGEALSVRSAPLEPASLNEEERSVEAVLATDAAVVSIDLATGKPVLEVWRMDGGVWDADGVPLIDTHVRTSIDRVKGSVRNVRREGGQLLGQLVIAASEYSAWSKIREKHIRDVSAGVQPLETTVIPAGRSRAVAGTPYTAPAGRPLAVHTKWRLREVSLTPIGSDPAAKIRTFGVPTMYETLRKWLEEQMGLRSDATPDQIAALWNSVMIRGPLEEAGLAREATFDQAEEFWSKLDETQRSECERKAYAGKEDEEEEDEEEDEDEDEEDARRKRSKRSHRSKRSKRAAACHAGAMDKGAKRAALEAERIREEADAAAILRVRKIRKLAGTEIPEELVARAIDENWSVGRAKGEFLEALRGGRTRSVGGGGNTDGSGLDSPFGIHTRNHEQDATVTALGMGMVVRAGVDLTKFDRWYAQGEMMRDDDGVSKREWSCRRVRSEAQRKSIERLMDQGDRYAKLSIPDLAREACRIEFGRVPLSTEDSVRAAMSGSALGAIFTTSYLAQFLGGYLDAADTTTGWCSESDVPNFLTNERAIFGKFGQLKKLPKGGTADDLDTSDWNETYKIARYAAKFIFDEQDAINDRFGALEQMTPQDMGLAARQLRPSLVYSALLANPTLNQDSVAVFDATHYNIVTGQVTDFSATAPTANAGPFQDATSLMGKQRLRNRPLNLRPRFCLCGLDLEWATNILYKSQQRIIASGSGGTYNPLAAEGPNVECRCDSRLDPLGCPNPDDGKTYYPYTTNGDTTGRSGMAIMAARPGEQGAKTMEVGYLRGSGRAPRVRSGPLLPGSGQYGYQFDVNLDIGVKILDFRGFVLITGGGSQKSAA
jgi:hypothetical protein